MVFVLSGGGTAGHITPAIAIAEALVKKYPDAKILFIGREGGKENDLVKKAGFEILTLRTYGLDRRSVRNNIRVIRTVIKAYRNAQDILSDVKADLVIGTGGYVCFPVLNAAKKLGIPYIMHESNSTPGLTTRLLFRGCKALCLGYKESSKHKKSVFVGNPLRKNFIRIPKERAKAMLGIPRNSFFIVSVGGSGGAKKLNETCITLMKNYSTNSESIYHLHSCGRKYYENICENNPELTLKKGRLKIIPFIDNMATVLSAADTVITRCGAMTLSEIAYCAVAPILIPSPNVAGNHQVKNAESFSKYTGAFLIKENELDEKALMEKINVYYRNPELRFKIGAKAKELGCEDANDKIIGIIDEILFKTEGI